MNGRNQNRLEILGACAIVLGIGLMILSQMGPSELPKAPSVVGSTMLERIDYQEALQRTQSAMMAYARFGTIGSWVANIGGFAWVGGLILSIAEFLRNKE